MAKVVQARHDDSKWTVRYTVGGKTRERTFGRKREAEKFATEVEHSKLTSTYVDPRDGRLDFCAYTARWIDGLSRTESTRKAYRSILNSRIRPAFEGQSITQVANAREDVWALVSGSGMSATRKSMMLWVIRGSLDEAVRAGRIPGHKLGGLSVASDATQPAEIIPATKDQLETLADGMRPQHELLVWLMRGAGLRISEALAVNVRGFRESGKTLRVHEQVTDSGTLGPLKHRRRGEYRDIPVPAWLWAKVQVHLDTYGAEDGYLFQFGGKFTTYKTLHPRFVKAAANTGLDGMTPHGLRHLYASTLLSNGVPISDVAAWLGHRNINVTFATYSHLLPNSWDRARNALESL